MQRNSHYLDKSPFDVLVIGGGIYGAWVAYDAALRGLRVAIVERHDWASGTSSASSKLIHGGLRYLEYGHVSLVQKTLQERSRLLRLAPHRVWPLRFVLPLTDDGRANRFSLTVGLGIYDFMAGRKAGVPGHQFVMRDTLLSHMPWIAAPDITGGFFYSDAGTDDARLTLELIAGAIDAGAVAVNYATVTDIMRDPGGKVTGGLVHDLIHDHQYEVRARVTVVTAGPWCSQVVGNLPSPIRFSKGVHLVMPPIRGAAHHAALLTAPQDRRVFFLIPWYGATLLGTTDDDYKGSLDDVTVTDADKSYLLTAVQQRCPQLQWTHTHMRAAFAGVRTLVGPAHGFIGSVSREWSLMEMDSHLLVSVGGKLTSARIEAATTVDRCLHVLGRPHISSLTHRRRLPWAPIGSWSKFFKQETQHLVNLGVDVITAMTAVRRYGTRVHLLAKQVQNNTQLRKRIDDRYPFCTGEIPIAIDQEMAQHNQDIFRRRIPLLALGGSPTAVKDMSLVQ